MTNLNIQINHEIAEHKQQIWKDYVYRDCDQKQNQTSNWKTIVIEK